MIGKQVEDLPLALIRWRDEEDFVGAGAGPIVEVAGVGRELGSKATRLLGAPIPLEMDQYLAVWCQDPAPSVRDWPPLIAFGVSPLDAVLADPVVKAATREAVRRSSQVDEEMIRLKLVTQGESTFKRGLGASTRGHRFLAQPFGQRSRPPPRQQIDRGTANAAWSHYDSPRTPGPEVVERGDA